MHSLLNFICGAKFITPTLYYDNFAFFQGGQDILIRVKFFDIFKENW